MWEGDRRSDGRNQTVPVPGWERPEYHVERIVTAPWRGFWFLSRRRSHAGGEVESLTEPSVKEGRLSCRHADVPDIRAKELGNAV